MDLIRLHCLLFLGISLLPLISTDLLPCIDTCQCPLTIPDQNMYLCGKTLFEVAIQVNQSLDVIVICQRYNGSDYLNNISQLAESIFNGAADLKILSLAQNRLRNLSAEIFKPLSQLRGLDLRFNCLTRLDDDAFQYVPNLTFLYLSNNQLNEVSKSAFAFLKNLTDLHLCHNKITRLENGIFDELPHLANLSLMYNKLDQIPNNLFVFNSKLRTVHSTAAFSPKMNSLPRGLFAGLQQLRHVLLDSNNLTILPPDLFYQCTNLRKVWLQNNFLQVLPATIFNTTTKIELINLRDNSLRYLDAALFSNLKHLKVLNLAGNLLREIGSDLLANLRSLLSLDLSRNELVDFQLQTFSNLEKLTDLNLGHNELTLKSWTEVSPLNNCTKLKYLNLTDNSLTRVFEDWRTTMTGLKSLDLSFNQLHNLTASDFMFTSTNYPTKVDFSSNPLKTINLSTLETLIESQDVLYAFVKFLLRQHRPVRFLLKNTQIMCDCDAFHLAKYFQNKMSQEVYNFINIRPLVICEWPDDMKTALLDEVDLATLTCPAKRNWSG